MGTGEIRRLGDSPEVAAGPRRSLETAAPSPRARAPAAPSVSPPGTHEAGQGRAGGNAEGPEWGGGRGAKSALSQAFFSPPAAPPGRTPCPQPPEPGRFLFLTPGAASCLSFELGCWLPTHSLSSSGPWACPLMGPSPQALLGVRLAQEAPEAPASGNQCPSLRPALPAWGCSLSCSRHPSPAARGPGLSPSRGGRGSEVASPGTPRSNFSTKHVDTEAQQLRDQGRLTEPRFRDWGAARAVRKCWKGETEARPGKVASEVKNEDTPQGQPAPRGARFSTASPSRRWHGPGASTLCSPGPCTCDPSVAHPASLPATLPSHSPRHTPPLSRLSQSSVLPNATPRAASSRKTSVTNTSGPRCPNNNAGQH